MRRPNMSALFRIMPFAAFALGSLGWLSGAAHAESFRTCEGFIDSLPATISAQGTWCLRKHLTTNIANGNAITINRSNVTIDCNHYRITGRKGRGTQAFGIAADFRQNITVRNCNIQRFRRGIAFTGSSSRGLLVEDNILSEIRETGIGVDGQGNLIRNNRIIDTGGGAGNASAYGIHAERNTHIRGNFIDAVVGTDGSNTTVYGIRLTGGTGVSVSGNVVRGLTPSGTGTAYGIYTSNGNKIFIDDNRVSLPAPIAGSTGYRCNSQNGALRNSTSWGFANASSGCLDDGGTASH